MKKYAILLCVLLILLSACTKKQTIPPEQLLGADDAQLVDARGEGLVTDYGYQGETLIMQRKYDEAILGLEAQAEYMYSDDQHVNQIVFTFESASTQDVIDAFTASLGEPVQRQDETQDISFFVLWQKDGVSYTLRTIPGAGVYMLMEKM